MNTGLMGAPVNCNSLRRRYAGYTFVVKRALVMATDALDKRRKSSHWLWILA